MNTERPRDPYTHEELEALAAGWALYALEPDTEAIFAEHLPQCASCQRAVDSYQATLGELALLTPQVDPPDSLGERISAAVRAETDGAPATGRATVPTERPAAPSPSQRQRDDRRTPPPGPGARPAPVESRGPGRGRQGAGQGPGQGREGRGPGRTSGGGPGLGPGRRAGRSRLAMVVAGTALAIVVAVGAWNVVLLGQVDDAERQADRQVEAAEERSERATDIVRQMAEPGARVTALSDSSGSPQGYVLLNGDNVEVVADGLPRNDAENSIYVLWAVDGKAPGAPRAVGSFDVKQGEFEQVRIGSLPSGGSGPSEFAVSREPGRQTPAKPTVVVASGKVEP